MSVVIIDYGSGNLHSALSSFERANAESGAGFDIKLTSSPDDVKNAERIVLPGVGAFADCYKGLHEVDGMHEALTESVIDEGKPFFGICVGMQMLAERGLEHGSHKGLAWIAGDVEEVKPSDKSLKIPHMGWNTLDVINDHALLDGIPLGPDGLHAYFVHSYHFKTTKRENDIVETGYGGPVTAMVAKDNIVGTQFHPEKSQKLGLALISNFLKWKP